MSEQKRSPPVTVVEPIGDLGLLMPAQRRWVSDASKVKIAEKGRRTGFTFGESSDNVITAAASREAGGRNVYYIGYNLEMAREYIAACGRWALGLQYAASTIGEDIFDDVDDKGVSQSIKAFRIDFPSGFYIQALSSRPRSLRGMQGDVIIDEAAFHDDLPGLIKAAMALLIWGGRVRIISTHNGEENPYNELLKECRAGRLPYSLHTCTFDTAIEEGLYRRICEVTGETWAADGQVKFVEDVRAFYRPNDAEELDCIPARSGGTYLPLTLLEPCVDADLEVVRIAFPDSFVDLADHLREREVVELLKQHGVPELLAAFDREAPSAYGSDFGRNGDLTVLWAGQVDQRNRRHTRLVLELRNCPFKAQEQIFGYVIECLPRFTAGKMDARGNGQALAEAMRQKFGQDRVEEVMLTRPWYLENWPLAKALIEDRVVNLPKDRDVLGDLRSVKVDKGVPLIPDRIAGSDKTRRHGDAAIAYVLFCAAARAEPFETGYEVPSKDPRSLYEPRGGETGRMRINADELDDDDDRPRARAMI